MGEFENINEFKTKCKENPNEKQNPKIIEYLKSIGIDSTFENPDYILERNTTNKGKAYQTDMFCLKQSNKYVDKSEFYQRLDTIHDQQDKLKKCKGNECWKSQIDGFGFNKETNSWCSTDPNTIVNLIDNLKTKNNVITKNNVNECDILNGIPPYYRGIQPKKKEQEIAIQKRTITPTKNITGVIPNESTEIFIPTNELSQDDAFNIENAIKDDGYKSTKDMLITYYTTRYDPDERKIVKDKHLLLNSCVRDGKSGFCAPIGLAGNVEELLNEKQIKLKIDDKRVLPTPHTFELNKTINVDGQEKPLIIRDYQQNIIDDAKEKGHGIIEVATGGGKTLVASGIIGAIGQDTAFIVPNNSLFYNAKKQIGEYVDKEKVNIGQVGGMNVDYKNDKEKVDINIISLPLASLAISNPEFIDPKKREVVLQALKNSNMIIFDETHHISADTYKKVAQFSPAKYRFGLSATPFRDDGKTLEIVAGVGGTLGHKIRAKTLIDKGFLASPEIYVINNDDIDPNSDAEVLDNLNNEKCNINEKTKMWKNVKELHRLPSRYSQEKAQLFRYIEKASVECNENRNDRVIDLVKKLNNYDKTKVVFVNSVEHGKKLQNMLEQQGIYSEILTGDTESKILKKLESNEELEAKEIEEEEEQEKEYNKKRAILFEKMGSGELKTIIATDKIMGEGVDIPAIDSLILTDMRKSRVSAMQMVGRALRKKEGKKKALIFDFNDPVEYLQDWMEERHEVWNNEEYPIKHIEYNDVDKQLEISLEGKPTIDTTKQKANDLLRIQNKQQQRQYEDLGLPELKKVAIEKGVKISGLKKQEIISRLMNK